MRGIRIDLVNQNATDQVYLEEARLEALRKAVEEIESGIESFRKEPESSPYRYLGADEFRHPHLRVHTINAGYYIAPDSIVRAHAVCYQFSDARSYGALLIA